VGAPIVLSAIDAMNEHDARVALERCCGARRWVERMMKRRPFGDSLIQAADEEWAQMERADILEAFQHHPRIGADLDALRKKFASTATWASGEQSGVASADEETLRALQQGNIDYEARYGFIFIVCATGKSAGEMLAILRSRLSNDAEAELRIAAGEQAKITRIRLEKL
jgi:2-oxo-4-hydroxy-4-carboxy-5-ureidoimidazoline decarboxylase